MKKTDLYRGCYLAKDIQKGDALPITSALYDENGYPLFSPDKCIIDESVSPLLESLHKIYDAINTEDYKKQYQSFFQKSNFDVPIDIFFPCLAVLIGRRKNFAKFFGDEEKSFGREMKYKRLKQRNLKDVLDDGEMMCGEYAIVTQLFFQSLGLDSDIFCGMRIPPTKNGEPDTDAEPHTFLVIKDKNRRYVFDEMLDRKVGKGIYPVIRKVPLSDNEWQNFISEIRPQYEGGKDFGVFPAADVFNNNVQYYGASDAMKILWTKGNIYQGTGNISEKLKTEGLIEKLSKHSENGENLSQNDTPKKELSAVEQAKIQSRLPQNG